MLYCVFGSESLFRSTFLHLLVSMEKRTCFLAVGFLWLYGSAYLLSDFGSIDGIVFLYYAVWYENVNPLFKTFKSVKVAKKQLIKLR